MSSACCAVIVDEMVNNNAKCNILIFIVFVAKLLSVLFCKNNELYMFFETFVCVS